MQIHIDGIDNVMAMINEQAADMAERLAKGVAEGCEKVKGEAKAMCPVSTEATRPGGPHGELRDSITAQSEGTTGVIGTNKEYAGYVEFGTRYMAAQPYLVPALKNKQGEVVAAIKKAVMG